jgi:hypothetical protein
MRLVFHAVLVASLAGGVFALAAAPMPQEPAAPTAEEYAAGQALAEHLRSSLPEESSTVTGKLVIKSDAGVKEIPISCQVTVDSNNWKTTYQTSATAEVSAEQLVVVHETNGPNQYLFARGGSALSTLAPGDVSNALAGSDFSLGDLGLEFLHWPVQRQLKGEMRLGQPCYVLESSNPGGRGVVRVRSDIDKESGGLLIADGYDADGKLVKEFSLHGSSFKKVNGHWKLQKMDIRNKKTGSHTELKFDIVNP